MTAAPVPPSPAAAYLVRTDERAARVVELASLVAPAAVVEPELIRALRLAVEPGFDTGVEADLWFSPLVQDRSPAGITLASEVVPALLDRLRDRVGTSAEGDPVRQVGAVIDEVHRHAPPLRVVQERVVWASIVDDMHSAELELARVLHAQRDATRRAGITGWVDRVLRRLPEPVQATRAAWQLGIEASIVTQRDAGLGADAPIELFDGDPSEATTTGPTTTLALVRRDGAVELGALEADIAFGIVVPATAPIIVRLDWPADGHARAVTIGANECVTVPDRRGPLRIRTLAGLVHEIGPHAVPRRAGNPARPVFTIEMLPAGNGTSLWIEYGDEDEVRRILVDGGPRRTADVLERRLRELAPDERTFELVILTHLDDGSSGGLVELLSRVVREPTLFGARDLWTNVAQLGDDAPGASVRPRRLAEQLDALGIPVNRAFPGGVAVRGREPGAVELGGGMRVTLLGPRQEALDRLRATVPEREMS